MVHRIYFERAENRVWKKRAKCWIPEMSPNAASFSKAFFFFQNLDLQPYDE